MARVIDSCCRTPGFLARLDVAAAAYERQAGEAAAAVAGLTRDKLRWGRADGGS